MTGNFIEGSTAAGVLVIIYSLSDSKSDDPFYIQSSASEGRNVMIDIRGLRSGLYGVSIFVVLVDGLPCTKAATKPRLVSVTNSECSGDCHRLLTHDCVYMHVRLCLWHIVCTLLL